MKEIRKVVPNKTRPLLRRLIVRRKPPESFGLDAKTWT